MNIDEKDNEPIEGEVVDQDHKMPKKRNWFFQLREHDQEDVSWIAKVRQKRNEQATKTIESETRLGEAYKEFKEVEDDVLHIEDTLEKRRFDRKNELEEAKRRWNRQKAEHNADMNEIGARAAKAKAEIRKHDEKKQTTTENDPYQEARDKKYKEMRAKQGAEDAVRQSKIDQQNKAFRDFEELHTSLLKGITKQLDLVLKANLSSEELHNLTNTEGADITNIEEIILSIVPDCPRRTGMIGEIRDVMAIYEVRRAEIVDF